MIILWILPMYIVIGMSTEDLYCLCTLSSFHYMLKQFGKLDSTLISFLVFFFPSETRAVHRILPLATAVLGKNWFSQTITWCIMKNCLYVNFPSSCMWCQCNSPLYSTLIPVSFEFTMTLWYSFMEISSLPKSLSEIEVVPCRFSALYILIHWCCCHYSLFKV